MSDVTVTKVDRYEHHRVMLTIVASAERLPHEYNGAKLFLPERVRLVFERDPDTDDQWHLDQLRISGPLYRADGILGTSSGYREFAGRLDTAPEWVSAFVDAYRPER